MRDSNRQNKGMGVFLQIGQPVVDIEIYEGLKT